MSEKASQLRIGIFVVVGVAILFGALFLFGIRSAFEPTYTLETYVSDNVDGLSVGSVVKLRGVTVGKVTEIGFSWNMYEVIQPAVVVVRFKVKQHISPEMFRKDFDEALKTVVASGLRATVQGQGITGTSVIALQTMDPKQYPPLTFPWKPDYPYIPSAPSQFGQILASIDKTLQNLSQLDIQRVVHSLDKTLVSASAALDRVSQLDVKSISDGAVGTLAEATTAIRGVEGLGRGDWKMAAMLGAFFGWQKMLLTVFLASVVGTLVGLGLILWRGKGARYALPLGTFLGAAGILVLFAGDPIVAWYGGLFE